MHTNCLFCGNQIHLIFVHGHYQCPVCKTNALPCCDGDNCTNAFITENHVAENTEAELKPANRNIQNTNKQYNI